MVTFVILVAVLVVLEVASLTGIGVADTRTGRDWQPRGGWQPTVDPRDRRDAPLAAARH